MSATGVFISLEGIEGAGKSTVARALEAPLRARGLNVVLTREPGGTPLAEDVRALVLRRAEEPISPLAETLLMCAARSIHVANLVRPALARGDWVICDRFSDATRAYQGAGRGVDAALIEQLLAAVHSDLWPQRTLLLELPVPLGLARARARRGLQDRFEDEDQRFFERVRARYLELARAEPQRIRVIDAAAAAEIVARRALAALADLLPGAPSGT
jgi:dTMP kinase